MINLLFFFFAPIYIPFLVTLIAKKTGVKAIFSTYIISFLAIFIMIATCSMYIGAEEGRQIQQNCGCRGKVAQSNFGEIGNIVLYLVIMVLISSPTIISQWYFNRLFFLGET